MGLCLCVSKQLILLMKLVKLPAYRKKEANWLLPSWRLKNGALLPIFPNSLALCIYKSGHLVLMLWTPKCTCTRVLRTGVSELPFSPCPGISLVKGCERERVCILLHALVPWLLGTLSFKTSGPVLAVLGKCPHQKGPHAPLRVVSKLLREVETWTWTFYSLLCGDTCGNPFYVPCGSGFPFKFWVLEEAAHKWRD